MMARPGNKPPVKPRAFRLDDARVVYATPAPEEIAPDSVVIEDQPDPYAEETPSSTAEAAVEIAERRGILRRSLISWGGLLASALGGLFSLAVGLWLTQLVE